MMEWCLSSRTELNLHMKEVVNTHRLSFTNLDNLAELIREANIPGLRNNLEAIQNTLNAHRDELDESYQSLTWNSSAHIVYESPFVPSPERKAKEEKEIPSHIKGEQEDMVSKEPKEAKVTEEEPQLTAKPIITESTPITKASGSSQITLRVDKGKGIATEDDPSQPKLMKALKEALLDKKEQMEKGIKGVELSKPEIMKVVVEVVNKAEVQIKGNKDFLKN
ncbi:hypothetical protein Tco_0916662 [Tanacetum coccineum]